MNNIIVNVAQYSGACELHPTYDAEANILEVASNYTREWTYGIDIDGNVVFDIDSNYKIANFDLLIPHHLWISKNFSSENNNNKFVDLEISIESIRQKSFNFSNLKIYVNKQNNNVKILFDKKYENINAYKLSKYCQALISKKDILCGFIIHTHSIF